MRSLQLIVILSVAQFYSAGGGAWAAPTPQYVLNDEGGVTVTWEFQDSLGKYFNYRLAGHEWLDHRLIDEQFVEQNINLDRRAASVILDWHPFAGHFRTSLGLFHNSQILRYSAEPTVDYKTPRYHLKINRNEVVSKLASEVEDLNYQGNQVQLSEEQLDDLKSRIPKSITIDTIHIKLDYNDIHVNADVHFRQFAPYWGFGWGNEPFSESRWRYGFDIGVLYHGKPKVALDMGGDILNIHPLLTNELYRLLEEEERELQNKLKKHRFMPYINFGLSYAY